MLKSCIGRKVLEESYNGSVESESLSYWQQDYRFNGACNLSLGYHCVVWNTNFFQ